MKIQRKPKEPSTAHPWLLGVSLLGMLSACATDSSRLISAPLEVDKTASSSNADLQAVAARREQVARVIGTPALPKEGRVSTIKPDSPAKPAGEVAADTVMSFEQLPLPSFINIVFGQMLKANFSVDPAVMAKTDLVTLRTGTPQNKAQVFDIARNTLKGYGVAVTELGGFYRISPDSNLSAYLPEIRRGRAQPEVPLPLRPVFQLVELGAVRYGDVSSWIKAMFGSRVNIQEDGSRNALLLSGQPNDVTAALEAIQVLDQPLMRGRSSLMVSPASLGAEDLARKLVEVLQAEGYSSSVGAGTTTPIALLPIPASNALLVFAVDPAVTQHVVEWAQKLDALENDSRRNGSYFSYKVKYADAQGLARTMQDLLSAGSAVPAGIGTAPKPPGRIVVNSATNTLIFTSTPAEYAQLLSIMKDLDQPAKSALVEVTVAEVRVTDKLQLGVEWGFGGRSAGSGSVTGGSLGGLGQGKDGFNISYLNNAGAVRATLNALASKNRANILSTPRIMARNGEIATIQVGQEVPVITSQQSSGVTTTGTGSGSSGVTNGVLQSIQYRSTGVILRVKPVIFAGNRVELEVSQEVSSAAETKTGVTSSPTISTRKLDTKLSIRDGATVLLGGLISSNDSKADTGLPLLKDVPVIGQLFRTNTDTEDKTELIMLITPYVIDDDLVAEQVTDAVRKQTGSWALPRTPVKVPAVRASTSAPLVGTDEATPVRQVEVPSAKEHGSSAAEHVGVPPQLSDREGERPEASDSGKGRDAQASPPPPEVPSPKETSAVDVPQMATGWQGKPVTDPALLDEFKRAASQGVAVTLTNAPPPPLGVKPTTGRGAPVQPPASKIGTKGGRAEPVKAVTPKPGASAPR